MAVLANLNLLQAFSGREVENFPLIPSAKCNVLSRLWCRYEFEFLGFR
jgi:hypothetical protein